MALTDHNDIFLGSTDDAWTFALLNTTIPAAHHILTSTGFTPREHLGRIVYLLAPGTPGTPARAGDAIGQLLPHSLDIVELAWTCHPLRPGTNTPDAHITVRGTTATATTSTPRAHAALIQAGFISLGNDTLRLTDDLDEKEAVDRIVRAEAHVLADGLQIRVDLGITTPSALPPAPRR